MPTGSHLRYEPQGKHWDTANHPWQPLLDTNLRDRAQKIALSVAQRMRDPVQVQHAAQLARKQSHSGLQWDIKKPTSVKDMALLYGYTAQCFPDQGWERHGQHYLRLMATATQQLSLTVPGLYDGTSGILFVIREQSQGGKQYQKTIKNLDQALCQQISVQSRCWQRDSEDNDIHYTNYDVISGAAGILSYLASIKEANEQVQEAISILLRDLLWLTEPGQPLRQERWFRTPQMLSKQELQRYPQGQFNCGVAHGLPGVLASLALVVLAGYRYPGMEEAIAYVSDWIVQHQVQDQYGINWPEAIPFEQSAMCAQWETLSPARTAWCYGAPGIARSLWLAGLAIDDTSLCQTALASIEAVLRKPPLLRHIDSPILCHGIAGLLQICLRFAHESQNKHIIEHCTLLTQQIIELFEAESLLGFRDREPEGVRVDQPDWLNGVPGIAMALLAAATAVTPTWHRLLLLA